MLSHSQVWVQLVLINNLSVSSDFFTHCYCCLWLVKMWPELHAIVEQNISFQPSEFFNRAENLAVCIWSAKHRENAWASLNTSEYVLVQSTTCSHFEIETSFFLQIHSDRIEWTFHTNYYIASILYFAWMWKKCHIYQSNKRKGRKKCRLNDAWQLALIIKHFETERERATFKVVWKLVDLCWNWMKYEFHSIAGCRMLVDAKTKTKTISICWFNLMWHSLFVITTTNNNSTTRKTENEIRQHQVAKWKIKRGEKIEKNRKNANQQ